MFSPRRLFLIFLSGLFAHVAPAQTIGGFAVTDFLVSAVHPNGCPSFYVTGPPDNLTWVNFSANQITTGMFGNLWTDQTGDELLLETSYHSDNYNVRLILSDGSFSQMHPVLTSDWTQISDTPWIHLFTGCTSGTQGFSRYVLPLDLSTHFGLTANDTVAGIEIKFMSTSGLPDLAGVYIVNTTPPCNVDLGSDLFLCDGDVATLDATTANAVYQWQDNSTDSVFILGAPGLYAVTVMFDNCVTSDSIEVSYSSYPQIGIGNDTVVCSGNTVLLDATTTGATYLWQNGSTNATFTVTNTGVYTVTATVNGCSASDTVVVDYLFPDAELGSDSVFLCDGDSLTLDVTSLNASYLWQDGSTNATFAVTDEGTYAITVSIADCIASDSVFVTYNSIPVFSLGSDTTLCPDDTLTLSAGIPGATFVWQNGSTNAVFDVVASGTYVLTADVNGCSSTDTIVIGFISPLSFDLGNDTTLCEGETTTLTATVVGAAYVWQDGSSSDTYVVNAPGDYAVTVSVSSCSLSDDVSIQFDALPVFDLGSDTALCNGDSMKLTVPIGYDSYHWQDNSGNHSFIVTSPGNYSVTVTDGVCTVNDLVNVQYKSLPAFSLPDDTTLCSGESLTLNASVVNGTYIWTDGSTQSSFIVVTAGSYFVTVTANGCDATDSIAVQYNPLSPVDLGGNLTFCRDESIELNIPSTPLAVYTWHDGSAGPVYLATESGTYAVTATLGQCSFSDTAYVEEVNCKCTATIPNAFTPNGDAVNDRFAPLFKCDLTGYNLVIHDRWGVNVFETTNPLERWDGSYQGEAMPVGVYAYALQYSSEGISETRYGNVTLLR